MLFAQCRRSCSVMVNNISGICALSFTFLVLVQFVSQRSSIISGFMRIRLGARRDELSGQTCTAFPWYNRQRTSCDRSTVAGTHLVLNAIVVH